MDEIKKHIISSLTGNYAHISIKEATKGFPYNRAGEKVPELDHSVWMLVYHIWICIYDIVEYSISENHKSPEYPKGYWPENNSPSSKGEWESILEKIDSDINRMVKLIEENDISTPFPWSAEHNLFREALILIDHNSYHIGQIVDLRFLLNEPLKDW